MLLKEWFDIWGNKFFSISCQELVDMFNQNLASVLEMWSSLQQLLSFAQHEDWKRGKELACHIILVFFRTKTFKCKNWRCGFMRGSVPDIRSRTAVTQSTFKRDLTKTVKNNPRYWNLFFFFFFRLKDEKKGLSVSDAAVKTKTEHCLLLKEDI